MITIRVKWLAVLTALFILVTVIWELVRCCRRGGGVDNIADARVRLVTALYYAALGGCLCAWRMYCMDGQRYAYISDVLILYGFAGPRLEVVQDVSMLLHLGVSIPYFAWIIRRPSRCGKRSSVTCLCVASLVVLLLSGCVGPDAAALGENVLEYVPGLTLYACFLLSCLAASLRLGERVETRWVTLSLYREDAWVTATAIWGTAFVLLPNATGLFFGLLVLAIVWVHSVGKRDAGLADQKSAREP